MELLKMTESTMKINFFFLNVLSSTGGQKIQLVQYMTNITSLVKKTLIFQTSTAPALELP